MSRTAPAPTSSLRRFPRVSGDEPTGVSHVELIDLFSPRERG